ncbi:MAG: TOBE domain-containing protein [Candidatus Methanomethylophilaceae archaeon]
MFHHNDDADVLGEGIVVGFRKVALDAYVLVDLGTGDYIQATMTRSRFDSMGLRNGSHVHAVRGKDGVRLSAC